MNVDSLSGRRLEMKPFRVYFFVFLCLDALLFFDLPCFYLLSKKPYVIYIYVNIYINIYIVHGPPVG